jgi:hypothetical protein
MANKVIARRLEFMRRYLIDVDDVSPATTPKILLATCELRWDFPEEEGVM